MGALTGWSTFALSCEIRVRSDPSMLGSAVAFSTSLRFRRLDVPPTREDV
jgi:hypothetical protein